MLGFKFKFQKHGHPSATAVGYGLVASQKGRLAVPLWLGYGDYVGLFRS